MNNFDRQGFLGMDFKQSLEKTKIAIVGIGGGGSHIVQQLSHMGFRKLYFVDFDILDVSNLTRMVLATIEDVGQLKVDIALRRSKTINPQSENVAISTKWQMATKELSSCKYIFSCLDNLEQREQLEMFCRRNGIIMIDIGMDVIEQDENKFSIIGQVFISHPGNLCMKCFNFFRKNHEREGEYGDAGPKPQVVFPNGILASNAINLFVKMISSSYGYNGINIFKIYNSSNDDFLNHPLLENLKNKKCSHYNN